jgi:hypothetical protein
VIEGRIDVEALQQLGEKRGCLSVFLGNQRTLSIGATAKRGNDRDRPTTEELLLKEMTRRLELRDPPPSHTDSAAGLCQRETLCPELCKRLPPDTGEPGDGFLMLAE